MVHTAFREASLWFVTLARAGRFFASWGFFTAAELFSDIEFLLAIDDRNDDDCEETEERQLFVAISGLRNWNPQPTKKKNLNSAVSYNCLEIKKFIHICACVRFWWCFCVCDCVKLAIPFSCKLGFWRYLEMERFCKGLLQNYRDTVCVNWREREMMMNIYFYFEALGAFWIWGQILIVRLDYYESWPFNWSNYGN